MAYHPLTNDTGSQTPADRRAEADRILKILDDNVEPSSFTNKEDTFIGEMREGRGVSPKQLLWLRDIKAKYAE